MRLVKIAVLGPFLLAAAFCFSADTPSTPPAASRDWSPLNDYIPCMLDFKQSYSLRGINLGGTSVKAAATSEAKKLNNPAAFNNLVPDLQALEGMPRAQVEPKLQADAVRAGYTEAQAEQIAKAAGEAAQLGSTPPPGIGCSMSIIPWKQASDNFGRRVASQYIAVQVVVRNLDRDNEFLVHDVELAVDANIAGLTRFQASQDKQIVRNVALRGQSLDPRNIVVRVMEGVGMIAGTAVGYGSRDFSLGYGSYSGGLVPAFIKVFPDVTVNQVNAISDMAFSSSITNRIVVPKSGSVPFVAFIPSAPLEQACWLQKGFDISQITREDAGNTIPKNACNFKLKKKKAKNNNEEEVVELNRVPYHNWTPLQLQALANYTFVVVAGAHIKEVRAEAPTATALNCPTNEDGGWAFPPKPEPQQTPAPTSGTSSPPTVAPGSGTSQPQSKPQTSLSCSLTGTNLEKIQKLRLYNEAESTDTKTADGAVTISGDTTNARVVFPISQLQNLPNDSYQVKGIDKNGKETNLGMTVKIR